MATFSVTTSADQDRAVQYLANLRSAQGSPITPLELARELIDHMLRGVVQRVREEVRVDRGDLFNRASEEDQAAIDAILEKYRATAAVPLRERA